MKAPPATLICEDVMANVKSALLAMRLEAMGVPIHRQGATYFELGPLGIRARSAKYPGVSSDA
jgi:hypothetical protein